MPFMGMLGSQMVECLGTIRVYSIDGRGVTI